MVKRRTLKLELVIPKSFLSNTYLSNTYLSFSKFTLSI